MKELNGMVSLVILLHSPNSEILHHPLDVIQNHG